MAPPAGLVAMVVLSLDRRLHNLEVVAVIGLAGHAAQRGRQGGPARDADGANLRFRVRRVHERVDRVGSVYRVKKGKVRGEQ